MTLSNRSCMAAPVRTGRRGDPDDALHVRALGIPYTRVGYMITSLCIILLEEFSSCGPSEHCSKTSITQPFVRCMAAAPTAASICTELTQRRRLLICMFGDAPLATGVFIHKEGSSRNLKRSHSEYDCSLGAELVCGSPPGVGVIALSP